MHRLPESNGIGRMLLKYTHAAARELGFSRIVPDSRQHAVGFYAKSGYCSTGKTLVYSSMTPEEMYINL